MHFISNLRNLFIAYFLNLAELNGNYKLLGLLDACCA